MSRRGSLFDDHYRADLLPSPTRLVNAIAYVLGNAEHHYGHSGIDAFSSAGLEPLTRLRVLGEPTTWLLRAGWKRGRDAARLSRFGFASGRAPISSGAAVSRHR